MRKRRVWFWLFAALLAVAGGLFRYLQLFWGTTVQYLPRDARTVAYELSGAAPRHPAGPPSMRDPYFSSVAFRLISPPGSVLISRDQSFNPAAFTSIL